MSPSNGGGSYTIDGISGMTCGLVRSDPITVVTSFGFALAGMFWPEVYPTIMDRINKRWKEKVHPKPPEVTDVVSDIQPDVPPAPKRLRG